MLVFRAANLFRHLPFIFARSLSTVTQPIQAIRSPHTTRLDLDQLLERLDGEAHRRGRLNPGLVRGALRKATIELDTINPTQALLLIRCTGSLLVSELPRQRQQVLDHLMDVFKRKNVPLDVTHYNSYMRVSLQNNHHFDPEQILNEMKQTNKNIVPNLTSFRLILECYARQGRSNDIQTILNQMKLAHFNIEPLTLTHLLGSYAQQGNIERVQTLFNLFNELELKPISETYEQFLIGYLQQGQILEANKYFITHVSKLDNDSLFRLLIQCAQCQQRDLFECVINAIDKNSLADICVQYILSATTLLEANLDDYAFILVDSFPKRDEILRFDVINLTMLNLMKIRLPNHHFRPFSALTLDEINNNMEISSNFKSERESVDHQQLQDFRQSVLARAENFPDKKDRWLAIHQLLHHAYQNYIPLAYIYAIYDSMHGQEYEYRPHYIRPILVKFRRMFNDNPKEMVQQIEILLNYLQKNFSINYDNETIDLLIEFFFDQCQLTPIEIDILLKKVQIRLGIYWSNLYGSTLQRANIKLLHALKIFLTTNRTIRFEYTTTIREQTVQTLQRIINQLAVEYQEQEDNQQRTLENLTEIIDFVDVLNRRFVKNHGDVILLNDFVLTTIVDWFLAKEQQQSIELLKQILHIFDERSQTIPLTEQTRETIYERLGMKSSKQINEQLMSSLKKDSPKLPVEQSRSSSDIQFQYDDSGDVYIKTSQRNARQLTIRELEDHLIELKQKQMNISGTISKLLTKYCTECLDGERTLTGPTREVYMRRIGELEAIYFDKKQTSGYPSLGVIAILIDYYSRVELNLDKVIHYISLSNEYDPKFKLDPHKCVSVIRLLIRKHEFDRAIQLINSLGRYENVPNYMYRRVRDLLLDAFILLDFQQFEKLVDHLLENNYVEPSSIVLSFIVRKCYEEHGPLHAFETSKRLFVKWNNLVSTFPIIRKLLRDDCTEELKQVLVKIGKIRTRTYAYEQLAFALIHERRFAEAINVCQQISRATFEEHCQRYVRELFYFPSDNESTTTTGDPFEANHVFDSETISLVNFLDFFEQYPSNTRPLSADVLFFTLFKAFEKTNRLDTFTKLMHDHGSKYVRSFSSKTKDAFSQAGISLSVKSLSSPKQSKKRISKHERFLRDKDYEEEQQQ